MEMEKSLILMRYNLEVQRVHNHSAKTISSSDFAILF